MQLNLEKNKGLFITFLALLGATPPLSTDMYLAAIPQIASDWGVGTNLINLTLVLWFASFSLFILVAGSLSDKYGRKPILMAGLFLFVVSSFMCVFSQNAYQLIAFRVLQGMGAAAPSAIVMAIIRDKFTGRDRQQAIAYVMTIVSIAPMVAPIIGAMLLEYFSWRFIFVTQAVMVTISFLISFGFEESIHMKVDTSLAKLVTRYAIHFKNKQFMFASLSMGGLVLPFYGFIAFSPIYYISMYGLSEKMFSLFFGINAVASMTGAYAASRVAKKFDEKLVITISVISCIFAGVCILAFAGIHYLFLLVFMSWFSFSVGISRPISGGLILGLVETDVGSASSFLVFYQFMSGALCMALVTHNWSNPLMVFGLVAAVAPTIVLILWLWIAKSLNPIH